MTSDFEERARLRRTNWNGAAVASHGEMDNLDRAFWRDVDPSIRLDAVWSMAQEAWRLKRGDEPAPRLFGSAVGIRKRRG